MSLLEYSIKWHLENRLKNAVRVVKCRFTDSFPCCHSILFVFSSFCKFCNNFFQSKKGARRKEKGPLETIYILRKRKEKSCEWFSGNLAFVCFVSVQSRRKVLDFRLPEGSRSIFHRSHRLTWWLKPSSCPFPQKPVEKIAFLLNCCFALLSNFQNASIYDSLQ